MKLKLHKLYLFYILSFLFLFNSTQNVFAQLTVSPTHTATVLAANIAGSGVSVFNETLTCPGVANGTFTVVPGTLLGTSGVNVFGINSGILLTTGHAANAAGAETGTTSSNNGAAGDPAMAALALTATTFDACELQFDFVPKGDTISFNYIFGSEEYIHSTCGNYDDAFAFFISGPGIVGTQNMALVPGTTLPVLVNTINCGAPCVVAGWGTYSNCTSIGGGSPFPAFYIDNTLGTNFAYRGYTKKLKAYHSVTPCDTYHLKMAIVDAGNGIFDSGVFIEAASLSTNTFHFDHADPLGATILGIPNSLVKGCIPSTIEILSSAAVAASTTLNLTYSGTGIKGIDFIAPDSAVMLTGDTSVVFNVLGLPTPIGGLKTVTVYLNGVCGILDSMTFNLIDTPTISILTPDTSICSGSSFTIRTTGTPGLTYNWTPTTGLSSATIPNPVANPSGVTVYTLTSTLPGSGCPPLVREVTISMDSIDFQLLTRDTSVCSGQIIHIRVNGADTLHYLWTPTTGLDTPTIKNPTATPSVTTTYVVTASANAGCVVSKTLTITVVSVSDSILTPDTAICRGASVQVVVAGGAGYNYQWIPTAGIASSTSLAPLITPDTSAMYYLMVTVPGCTGIIDSVYIDVQPNPIVYIGGNRSLCKFDTIHIASSVLPAWYTHYIYSWTPTLNLDNPSAANVAFTAGDSTEIVLTVTTSAHCTNKDSALIIVHPGDFAVVDTNRNICPGDSVQLNASGAAFYYWHPNMYISDTLSPDPWVHAITSIDYTLLAISSFGCRDTVNVSVFVRPQPLIYLPDSVLIYPGETYQIAPQTNCSSFKWFPSFGLSNPFVANPVDSAGISMKYIVTATTEWGCSTQDSITIYVATDAVLDIPNAFTPGTGINNIFKINKRGIASLNYLRIYNRWGNLIYEGTDIDSGWNGTYNGVPQPFDVYVYVVEAVTFSGNTVRKKGNLTLLR